MRVITLIARPALVFAALVVTGQAASADPVADFYQGKTVRVIIGYGAGGGYDIYGRLAAEFLGRYIPGHPTVIPQNMPGAGSFKAIEYLYGGGAAQDGTFIGTVAQTMAVDALTDPKVHADVTKLKFLGRLVNNTDVGYVLPKSGLKTFDDLRKREVIAGASGGGSTSVVYPLALNAYAGTKMKLVRGYEGTAEIQLALERGEAEINPAVSLPGILGSHPDWVKNGDIIVLYQNALKRDPVLPNVPTMPELGTSDEGRTILRVIAGTTEIGRSILTTPGVPAARLAALRKAFKDMATDREFLAIAQKRNLQIAYASGEELDAIVAETMRLPKPTVEVLAKLLKE
jgi:tripartite-type tricarboxylate transporter receptor subunit TctC